MPIGPIGLSVPHMPATPVRFGASRHQHPVFGAETPPDSLWLSHSSLAPPSRMVNIVLNSGPPIRLRRWWPVGTPEPPSHSKRPVVLLIHGLGGRSAWMSPLTEALFQRAHGQGAEIYGLEIPEVGAHESRKGRVESFRALSERIRMAIEELAQRHGGPVHAVGLSLGGMLLSSVAGNHPPEALKSVVLLSPAFKPHPEAVNLKVYAHAAWAHIKSKLQGKDLYLAHNRTERESMSVEGLNPLQRQVNHARMMARDRVESLPFGDYLKMFAMMRRVRRQLAGNIHLPVLVYATDSDKRVDPQAIREAFERFPSRNKHLEIFPDADHDLVLDRRLPEIADAIDRFHQDTAAGG